MNTQPKHKEFLNELKHSWTAKVKLRNNTIITIWYTALPMTYDSIKEVIEASSDYPKHII
jgi:hypothetical protein